MFRAEVPMHLQTEVLEERLTKSKEKVIPVRAVFKDLRLLLLK